MYSTCWCDKPLLLRRVWTAWLLHWVGSCNVTWNSAVCFTSQQLAVNTSTDTNDLSTFRRLITRCSSAYTRTENKHRSALQSRHWQLIGMHELLLASRLIFSRLLCVSNLSSPNYQWRGGQNFWLRARTNRANIANEEKVLPILCISPVMMFSWKTATCALAIRDVFRGGGLRLPPTWRWKKLYLYLMWKMLCWNLNIFENIHPKSIPGTTLSDF